MNHDGFKIIGELVPRADSGDPVARHLLGELYRSGMRGVVVDPILARHYLSLSDSPPYGSFESKQAHTLNSSQEYRLRAAQELVVARGCRFSEVALYDVGDLAYVDIVKVKAEAGEMHAQSELGAIYQDGLRGISTDIRLAEYWLSLAARQGSASAHTRMKKLLKYERYQLYQEDVIRGAALKGHSFAIKESYFCFDEETFPKCFDFLISKSCELSKSTLPIAAIRELYDAENRVSLKDAAEKSFEKATLANHKCLFDHEAFMQIIETLSRQNDAKASFSFGVLCGQINTSFNGYWWRLRDLVRDVCSEVEMACFLNAANKGHAEAQVILGGCFKIPRPERVAWLAAAAEQGDNKARMALAGFCLDGDDESGLSRDVNKYLTLLHSAADSGDSQAMGLLAHYYDYGSAYGHADDVNTCAKDAAKAFYWYRECLRAGGEVDMIRFGYLCALGPGRDLPLAFECWLQDFLCDPRCKDNHWNSTLRSIYESDFDGADPSFMLEIVDCWGAACAELLLRGICYADGFVLQQDSYCAFVCFKLAIIKWAMCEEQPDRMETWFDLNFALVSVACLERKLSDEQVALGCRQAEALLAILPSSGREQAGGTSRTSDEEGDAAFRFLLHLPAIWPNWHFVWPNWRQLMPKY